MTTPRQCSVLLLKAADAKYEDAFQSESLSTSGDTSFDVHFADVLTFEYVKADALRDVLLRLDDYSAILVTSPRAGIAVRNVISSLEDEVLRERVVEALRATAVFSVGKATSRELECLGVDCRGDHCGSAEVMAEYIHQDGILPVTAATKPVVFLCGGKRRDTLPDSFHERGKPLVELCVYRTCAVSDFQLPEACQTPDWVVFFSPSGVKATRSVAVAWETVRKAAIGACSWHVD
jgi:uroporphyrinogen-III synthase